MVNVGCGLIPHFCFLPFSTLTKLMWLLGHLGSESQPCKARNTYYHFFGGMATYTRVQVHKSQFQLTDLHPQQYVL